MRWALAMMLAAMTGCGKDAGSPWDMALGGGTEREVEVAFGEGRAAVLVDGKALTVVDEASGSVVWRDDLAAAVPRAPAWVAAQSGWLTVDADGVVTLRDGKNGTERWRLETGKHGFGPVLVDGSRAYFGAGRELVALDLDARGVAWARALSERWPVSARPTLDGHHLYMEVGEDIIAIEAATGAVAWRHATSSYAGRAWSRPVAVAGGKVLAGTTTKAFVALAEGDGKALWSATPGPRTFSDVVDAAALVAGDRVCWGFVVITRLIEARDGPSSDNALRLACAKIDDGDIVWTQDLPLSRSRDLVGGAPLLADGRLWVVVSGELRGYAVSDGAPETRAMAAAAEPGARLVAASEAAVYLAAGTRLYRVPSR